MFVRKSFEDFDDCNLFTYQFYILEHIVKNLFLFAALNVLHVCPHEHINYFFKKVRKIAFWAVH